MTQVRMFSPNFGAEMWAYEYDSPPSFTACGHANHSNPDVRVIAASFGRARAFAWIAGTAGTSTRSR